jgi:peptidoglycan hydrolase-like protein with peptidoglycan-binding domain
MWPLNYTAGLSSLVAAPREKGLPPTFIVGDVGTGEAPSVDLPEMGPAAGGTHYTDAGTIAAVQRALNSRGYKVKVDGKFGPETEGALYKVTGQHGPPDDAALSTLGVSPGGSSAQSNARSAASPSKSAIVSRAGSASTAPSASFLTQNVPGLERPVWQVVLGGLGVAAIGTGLYLAFSGSPPRRRR